MNFTLSLDNDVSEKLKSLAPHKGVFDLDGVREVSRNLSMPKPVIATIAGFMDYVEPPDPIKLAKMEALFI